MMYLVKQTIVTQTRRIPVGDVVNGDDIDGPLTVDDWLRLGFLATDQPPTPMAAPAAFPDAE